MRLNSNILCLLYIKKARDQKKRGGNLNARKRIKVLIVDDSNVFREMLSRAISTDPNIEVVATAVDPFECLG